MFENVACKYYPKGAVVMTLSTAPRFKVHIKVFWENNESECRECIFFIELAQDLFGRPYWKTPISDIHTWLKLVPYDLTPRIFGKSAQDNAMLEQISIFVPSVSEQTDHIVAKKDHDLLPDAILTITETDKIETEDGADADIEIYPMTNVHDMRVVSGEEGVENSNDAEIIPIPELKIENFGIHRPRKETRLFIRQEALKSAQKHAKEDLSKESGGVLLGCFVDRENGVLDVIVTGIIRARYVLQEAAALNFTCETWADILSALDQDPIYSNDNLWRIVGWYHTHPGLGVFFSQTDLFLHEEHFSHPGHIALVIDPQSGKLGWFGWDDKLEVEEILPQKVKRKTDNAILNYLLEYKGLTVKNLPVEEIKFNPIKKEERNE